jgi:cold shock CspA family protein
VNGKMLWFNAEKGYGFIRTEHDERLYVARNGFQPGQAPAGRCAGRDVVFERVVREGDTRAISVAFPPESSAGRARRRHGTRGYAL